MTPKEACNMIESLSCCPFGWMRGRELLSLNAERLPSSVREQMRELRSDDIKDVRVDRWIQP